MPNSDQRPKITVEDLLRLKRAERPAAEFWANFESELRQKQLTALLDKRPWWQELPQFLARRAYIPVGTAAILAFTLVSVKFYTPAQLAPTGAAKHEMLEPAATFVSALVSSPLVNRREPAVSAVNDRTAVAGASAESPPSIDTIELMPQVLAPHEVETPSARSIAANLAVLEQSEPELVNAVMGSRLSPPARVQTAAAMVTELASVPTNASKRNRLFTQYNDRLLSPEPTAPDIVRERLARRLGDNEITDRLSRIGLKGDQVSLGLTLRL
ncbi:MAG: hypothetical protein EXS42_03265 [Lacunisphaera sp.]|nr:hypothetical protein [Lacunisphaera sp.]